MVSRRLLLRNDSIISPTIQDCSTIQILYLVGALPWFSAEHAPSLAEYDPGVFGCEFTPASFAGCPSCPGHQSTCAATSDEAQRIMLLYRPSRCRFWYCYSLRFWSTLEGTKGKQPNGGEGLSGTEENTDRRKKQKVPIIAMRKKEERKKKITDRKRNQNDKRCTKGRKAIKGPKTEA